MSLRGVWAAALALLVLLGTPARFLGADPVITEIVAAGSTLADSDGDDADWIEIYWPGPGDLDLAGWYLTDTPLDLTRFRIPSGTVGADEYLVIFASGKNGVRNGEIHTNFELAAEGEYVALVHPDGKTVVSELAPRYPPQRDGYGWGVVRGEIDPPLVARGSDARYLVPQDDSLGLSWTGDPDDEPFSDASWTATRLGVGYPGGGGVEPPRPLAYWTFDSGSVDATGNGHDLVRHGTSSSVDTPFGLGRSILFDGVDDYASAEIDVSETGYAVSFWFRTRARTAGLFSVVQDDLGGGGHDRHLYLTNGNIGSRVWNDETIISTGLDLADDNWHHVVHRVGLEIAGQEIWVDGSLVARGTKATSDFDWQERVNIGFSNDASPNYFNGRIDNLAVFDGVLDENAIASLFAGSDPLSLGGVTPFVESDIEADVRSISPTVLVRVPFDVEDPAVASGIVLRMRYDDGFIAWLNGVEIARANAPAVPSAAAVAPQERSLADVRTPTSFELASFIDLVRPGRNILAIQGFNHAVDSSELLIDPELVFVEETDYRYVEPTPGAPNGFGFVDFVDAPVASRTRGLAEAPFQVTLTTATTGAEILYTTDGSIPAQGSPATRKYEGPISITTTTTLRARATLAGHQPSDITTHTYIFIADVVEQPDRPAGLPSSWGGFAADYGMDPDVVRTARPGYSVEEALRALPTVSIVADPQDLFDPTRGIYYHSSQRGPAWERTASFELFYPDGSEDLQINAGIRMHGNSSRNHSFTPKHPIRVLFKRKHGPPKLEYPLFPGSDVERFDQLLLRGCSTDSWPVVDGSFVLGVQRWHPVHATYFRDQYMRDTQNEMGHPSGHGIYVHLYLNGLYWGVYNLAERPTDSFQAEHFGGDRDEYDVLKDFAEIQSGNGNAWNQLISLANAGLANEAAYQRIQGNRPDGTRDPALEPLLDVDNLIDYMILHIHAGAEDWPDHNWWAGRRRGPNSEGFKFFVWDQEISNDSLIRTHTRIQTRFEQPISSPSPSSLYGRLMANPSFRRKFIDRVHLHLFGDGLLTPARNRERWLRRQNELDLAIVAESARWGDSKKSVPYRREVEWLAEMNWMHQEYWPKVQPIAIDRFRRVGLYPNIEAPVFRLDGEPRRRGGFEPGALLAMVVPDRVRTIEELVVDDDTPVSAHVPSSNLLGADWRSPSYVEGDRGEAWVHGTNGVGYEATSGYEDMIGVDVETEMLGAGRTVALMRIRFDVSSAALGSAEKLILHMFFDDGFVAWLNGVEIARANAPNDLGFDGVATTASEAEPTSPVIFEIEDGLDLLVPGENLLAIQGFNFSAGSSDFLVLPRLALARFDDGPIEGAIRYTLDGSDPMDPSATSYTGPIALTESVHVKARARDGNEWSALEEGFFYRGDPSSLRIAEIMYRPPAPLGSSEVDPEEYEYLELINAGDAPVLLPGTRIEGGVTFEFSREGPIWLAPGDVILVVENTRSFLERYPGLEDLIAGEWKGQLANSGEELRLISPLDEVILDFSWDDDWYPQTDGGGFSLVVRDPLAPPSAWSSASAWAPSAEVLGTPGVPDWAPIGGRIRPGDGNADGSVDLSDAILLLLRLFGDPTSPLPCEGGLAEGGNLVIHDIGGDSRVDISDAIALLQWLFQGGTPPAAGATCRPVEGCASACTF